jgi:tryptophanyl-tRNA synthetase
MRILSGVQPTGNLHLGNYLGAIKQFAKLQQPGNKCFYSVVDLHAITAGKHDPNVLAQHTREIAAAYIASGVDPNRSTIFVQSQVPEIAELHWLLCNVARMGWLERMTQYREKTNSVPPADLRGILSRVEKVLKGSGSYNLEPLEGNAGTVFNHNDVLAMYDMLSRVTSNKEGASVGLFTYPVLMAADILSVGATHVPVGHDQRQHLNLARDIIEKLNTDFLMVRDIPEALHVAEGARVMSLKDGTRKMSKSDADDAGRINMTDSDEVIAKKVRKATADSLPFPEHDVDLKPEVANLISIYAGVSGLAREAIFAEFAGKGWGVFKPALTDVLITNIGPIRNQMERLLKDEGFLDYLLGEGAMKAREEAARTLGMTKHMMGFYGA